MLFFKKEFSHHKSTGWYAKSLSKKKVYFIVYPNHILEKSWQKLDGILHKQHNKLRRFAFDQSHKQIVQCFSFTMAF